MSGVADQQLLLLMQGTERWRYCRSCGAHTRELKFEHRISARKRHTERTVETLQHTEGGSLRFADVERPFRGHRHLLGSHCSMNNEAGAHQAANERATSEPTRTPKRPHESE